MAPIGAGERPSWGVPIFILALLIGGLVWWLRTELLVPLRAGYEPILATAGALGALVASYLSHSAYPRVHNLKIYVLGIGIATSSLIAILLVFGLPQVIEYREPAIRPAALSLSYAGALLVLLATVVMPDFASFRVTRRAAGVIVAVLVIANALTILVAPVRLVLAYQILVIRSPESTLFWVVNAIAASILLLTIFREAHSLGIGGIHAGSTAILALGWVLPGGDTVLHGLVLAALPVFLSLAIVVHWFQRLENRAWYDPLLRIYNRSWCDQIIEEQSTVNTRPPFAVALIDLDHFKEINDTHGHDAGDVVLREVAQRIRSRVVPAGTVARYGGEEIVCFFSRTSLDDAASLMEELRTEIERSPVPYKKKRISVTASIGISVREQPEQALSAVMQAADKALYAAKKAGRNCVRTGRLRRKKA